MGLGKCLTETDPSLNQFQKTWQPALLHPLTWWDCPVPVCAASFIAKSRSTGPRYFWNQRLWYSGQFSTSRCVYFSHCLVHAAILLLRLGASGASSSSQMGLITFGVTSHFLTPTHGFNLSIWDFRAFPFLSSITTVWSDTFFLIVNGPSQ